MPRKTKLTKEPQDRITSVIAAGNYLGVAYRLAGVSHETFYRWLRLGKQGRRPYSEFHEAVKKAEARDLYEESKGKMQELARKQVSEMEELDGAIERAAALNKKVAAVLDGMLPDADGDESRRAMAFRIPRSLVELYSSTSAELRQHVKQKQELLGDDPGSKKADAVQSLVDLVLAASDADD